MVEDKQGGFCHQCQENRVIFRKGTNHILHLILTIVTWVWLPIWIIIAMRSKKWHCAACGSTAVKRI